MFDQRRDELSDLSGRDPLEELAEEFLERRRRGESPEISEYIAKHPALAEEIRTAFGTLLALERVGEADDRSADESPGDEKQLPGRLGEYTILREVGRGGMGVVYEAVQESLGRRVALKVLPFHRLMNPSGLERFQREARAAAALQHPNIVPVHAVGEDEGVHYYAMQFIHGQGLDEVLVELRRLRRSESGGRTSSGVAPLDVRSELSSEIASTLLAGRVESGIDDGSARRAGGQTPAASSGPRSSSLNVLRDSSDDSSHGNQEYFRNIARIGLVVAEALSFAHDHGVLHRDVKPSNLLLEAGGAVWLTDFGLAKERESVDLTLSGEIVGTLRYLAPERLRGWSDARSDVYALGATLYELLTLEPAFDAADRGRLLKAISEEEPRPPRAIDGRVPRDLETIVLKAMEKNPERRYSMTELASDLGRFLRDEPIHARRPSTLERATKWSRRHRSVVAAAAGMLVVALVALTIGMVLVWRERAGLEALNERLERQIYVRNVNGALNEWERGEVAAAEMLLEACPERLRDWEWRYGKRLCQLEDRTLSEYASPDRDNAYRGQNSLAHSPDGRWIVFSDARRGFDIRDAHTGEPMHPLWAPDRTTLPIPPAYSVSFSATGDLVAAGHGAGLVTLWEARTGKLLEAWRDNEEPRDIRCVAISADSAEVVASSGTATVTWRRGINRPGIRIDTRPVSPVCAVTLDEMGERVAVGINSGTIRVWDVKSGKRIATFQHEDMVFDLAFSPDRRTLASTGWDRSLRLWDVERGVQTALMWGHEGFVRSVSFGRDGRYLVTASEDRTVRVWNVARANEAFVLRGHRGFVISASLSPGNKNVVSASLDGSVKIWNVARAEGQSRSLQPQDSWIVGLTFTPGGERLLSYSGSRSKFASGAARGGVRIWDTETLQPLGAFGSGSHHEDSLSVRPDGLEVAIATDNAIEFWSIDGRLLRKLDRLRRPFQIRYSHDGTSIVFPSGKDVVLVDATSGLERRRYVGRGAEMRRVNLSAQGRLVAGATAEDVVVWDAASGVARFSVEVVNSETTQIQCLSFSPDEQQLAMVAGFDVMLRDCSTGQVTMRLVGHQALVSTIAFSPAGSRLASADLYGKLRLWDTVTGDEVLTRRGSNSGILALSWSPSGNALVTGGIDRTVRVWDATPRAGTGGRAFEVHSENVEPRHGRSRRTSSKPDLDEVFANRLPEFVHELGWKILKQPGHDRTNYLKAHRWAELLCAAEMRNPLYLATLGISRYRLGELQGALATLADAEDAMRGENEQEAESRPSTVTCRLFTAMCHYRLGDRETAVALLDDCRSLLAGRTNGDLPSFLREAEALIE